MSIAITKTSLHTDSQLPLHRLLQVLGSPLCGGSQPVAHKPAGPSWHLSPSPTVLAAVLTKIMHYVLSLSWFLLVLCKFVSPNNTVIIFY